MKQKYFDYENKKYLDRRKEDVRKTKILENFMDTVYSKNDFHIERVDDIDLQKKGVDLIHIDENNVIHYIDEKYAIKYYNKDLKTFSFELFALNNKDKKGWFISPNTQTTDYCLLWFQSDENFENIYTYDLCVIPKHKIVDFLINSGYYSGIEQDFLKYWETDNNSNYNSNPNFYTVGEKNNKRRYLRLKNGCKLVQSIYLEEQPINVIIPRTELYKLATKHFFKK